MTQRRKNSQTEDKEDRDNQANLFPVKGCCVGRDHRETDLYLDSLTGAEDFESKPRTVLQLRFP
jgi:hypothetical protein